MTIPENDVPRLADEYVLGLLDPAEAADLEREMAADARLRDAVAASRDRFLPLDESVEPKAAGEELWDRIAANLPQRDATRATATDRAPANDNRQPVWRSLAMASMAACLLLAVGLGWTLTTKPEPVVIAVLVNAAGEPQAIVEDYGNERASVSVLADIQVPDGRTMQVWTLPDQDTGPVSLGLLKGDGSSILKGPALPRPHDAQLYEITLEQAGGSPTGRPTGPVLAKGLARMPR
ncbi:putative anti-sigmaE protein [Hartmannibacter diazotrophicus]|uniref:Putative anti-sigmaE protein n=1 Tax=Hartmannibacter diazotrophicus TaxID=1482074 RepID=A0A2C9D4P8_9HYPH|nr:anti-sigma factor [Hartmannibacter diazotrophicus]SON55149.1 putative anti-sigmaE protein [Hartmannibacter diazotrophicus]